MNKQVMLHEVLYALELLAADDPEVRNKLEPLKPVLVDLCDLAADLLAEKLGVEVGPSDFSRDDLSCWGPMVSVRQAFADQPVPECLREIDPEADWGGSWSDPSERGAE